MAKQPLVKHYHFYWEIFDFVNNFTSRVINNDSIAAFICGSDVTQKLARIYITNPYVDIISASDGNHIQYTYKFSMNANYPDVDMIFIKSDMLPPMDTLPLIRFYVSRKSYLFNPKSISRDPSTLNDKILARLMNNDVDDIKLLNVIHNKVNLSRILETEEIESSHECSICYHNFKFTLPLTRCCGKFICLECINKQTVTGIICGFCRQDPVKYYFDLERIGEFKDTLIDEFKNERDTAFYLVASRGTIDRSVPKFNVRFITDPVNLEDIIEYNLLIYQPKLLFKETNLNNFFQLRPLTNLDIIII